MLETEAAQDGANQLNNDGPPWLKKLPAISTQAPNLNLNLNVAPPVIEQDLNEQPLADDPQEVLILPLPQINHPQEIANQQMAEIAIQQSVPAEIVIHPEGMMEEVAENQLEDGPQFIPKEPVNLPHLEIPEEELIRDLELQNLEMDQPMDWQQEGNVVNLHVGMVRIDNRIFTDQPRPFSLMPPLLPQFDPAEKANKAIVTDFVATMANNRANLKIPTAWADFLKALLGAPVHSDWAKKLLQTSFPFLIQQPESSDQSPLPEVGTVSTLDVCGKLKNPVISSVPEEIILEDQEASPSPQSKKRTRKNKVQSPIVDSEVRRSNRVKEKCNGFKTSQCKIANCLGCSVKPPILQEEQLRNIGTSLCQIPQDQLEEGALNKKKKVGAVGKKKSSVKIPQNEDDDKNNSKSKKKDEEA